MRLGEHQRSAELMDCDEQGLCDLTVQERNVQQVIIHEDYEGACKDSCKDSTFFLELLIRPICGDLYKFDLERNSVLMNNIAIIKLEEKVQETDFVSPICLNLRLG